jgi:hypothetical protein
MGEIKSTMDIIMEKTKSLTMSVEEKTEYKHKEMTGKVRGLINKFLEGVLKLDKFKVEVATLSGKQEDAAKEIILQESIPHIQLGANNEPYFTSSRKQPIQMLGQFARRRGQSKTGLKRVRLTAKNPWWKS